MSYTPADQEIAPACQSLIASIDQFCAVVAARVQAMNDWDKQHIREIVELSSDLTQIRLRVSEEL